MVEKTKSTDQYVYIPNSNSPEVAAAIDEFHLTNLTPGAGSMRKVMQRVLWRENFTFSPELGIGVKFENVVLDLMFAYGDILRQIIQSVSDPDVIWHIQNTTDQYPGHLYVTKNTHAYVTNDIMATIKSS